jgi:hypothetical protein
MNVQLLSIKSTTQPRLYLIEVLIAGLLHQFNVTVESCTVANQEIQVINGDDQFSNIFRFNQIIASEICQVVAKFHNHQTIDLPLEIGEFYSNKLEPIEPIKV